jgi:hypothetical protein
MHYVRLPADTRDASGVIIGRSILATTGIRTAATPLRRRLMTIFEDADAIVPGMALLIPKEPRRVHDSLGLDGKSTPGYQRGQRRLEELNWNEMCGTNLYLKTELRVKLLLSTYRIKVRVTFNSAHF